MMLVKTERDLFWIRAFVKWHVRYHKSDVERKFNKGFYILATPPLIKCIHVLASLLY